MRSRKTKQIHLHLTAELQEYLKVWAEEKGLTVTDYILSSYYEKMRLEEAAKSNEALIKSCRDKIAPMDYPEEMKESLMKFVEARLAPTPEPIKIERCEKGSQALIDLAREYGIDINN